MKTGIVLSDRSFFYLSNYVGVSAGLWDIHSLAIHQHEYFFCNQAVNSQIFIALFGDDENVRL